MHVKSVSQKSHLTRVVSNRRFFSHPENIFNRHAAVCQLSRKFFKVVSAFFQPRGRVRAQVPGQVEQVRGRGREPKYLDTQLREASWNISFHLV